MHVHVHVHVEHSYYDMQYYVVCISLLLRTPELRDWLRGRPSRDRTALDGDRLGDPLLLRSADSCPTHHASLLTRRRITEPLFALGVAVRTLDLIHGEVCRMDVPGTSTT